MPWRISQRGDQFCVVKTDGDMATEGCHPTRREALAHQAALYAAETEEAERSQRQRQLAQMLLGVMLDLDDEQMSEPES